MEWLKFGTVILSDQQRIRTPQVVAPVVLYTLPRLFHATSHVKEVDQNHIEICQSECMFRSHLPCDTDIFDLCMMYMVENSLQPPENLEEALELYIFLRISIHRDI